MTKLNIETSEISTVKNSTKSEIGITYDIIFNNLGLLRFKKDGNLHRLRGWSDKNDPVYKRCQNFLIEPTRFNNHGSDYLSNYPFPEIYNLFLEAYLTNRKHYFISSIGSLVESSLREIIFQSLASSLYLIETNSNQEHFFRIQMEMRKELCSNKSSFYSLSKIKGYLESILEGQNSTKKPRNNDDHASQFGNHLVQIIKNKLSTDNIEKLIYELDQIIKIRHPMAHFNPSQILDKNDLTAPEDITEVGTRHFIMPYSAMLPGFTEKYYLDLLTDDFIDPLFITTQKLIYQFYIIFN